MIQALPSDVERIPITDRAQWHKLRALDVTASVIGALVGVHDYQTPYELWARKSGLLDDVAETAAMERGTLLEPVAAELLRKRQPSWSVKHPVAAYYRDPQYRIGATPDAFAIDPARDGFGVVQIKSVEPSIFRKKWRSDSDHAAIDPPMWIVIQAIIEASLTGASWACVAALVVGHGLDLHVVDVPLHDGILNKLREAVGTFWRQVEAKTPPDPDFAADGAVIAALHQSDAGAPIDLSGDNMLPELAAEDAALAAQIKTMKARRDAIKAEVMSKMGDAALALYGGQIFATANMVHRKGYEVAPSSYRDLRLKYERGKSNGKQTDAGTKQHLDVVGVSRAARNPIRIAERHGDWKF